MPTKLDERTVRTAKAPARGADTIWDSEVRGFGARIFAPTSRHPEGARSFFINYRVDSRERRLTIGDFPTWSALAARNEAKELRRRIDRGEDPAREKREQREAPTVKDLAERYRREHLPRKAETSQSADWAMIVNEILPALGERKVAGIHHGDMVALHQRITASGRPVRANRVLAVASKMFAISLLPMAGDDAPWRDAAQGNPCKGVERNQEQARERFFSSSELAALTDALAEHESPAADCLRLIMLTGARPGETMRATWAEFDEEGYWSKSASSTKQRRVHRAPLSPAANELITQLRRKASDSEFVFPSERFKGRPIRDLDGVWKQVTRAAGLPPGALIYTLRHSFASIGAGGGLSLQIIGRLLGHTLTRTTQRYAHLADDPLREAAAKIGAAIAGAGKASGNVVTLPKRGGK
jgi:integrase